MGLELQFNAVLVRDFVVLHTALALELTDTQISITRHVTDFRCFGRGIGDEWRAILPLDNVLPNDGAVVRDEVMSGITVNLAAVMPRINPRISNVFGHLGLKVFKLIYFWHGVRFLVD